MAYIKKDYETERLESGIRPDSSLNYCYEYEDVKNNPILIWNKYEKRINKTLKVMSYWKSFDTEELMQQSYIYFIDLCKIYCPYYNGNFIPFDKYLFRNLIFKLGAYIQNYYLHTKREQPTDVFESTRKNSVNQIIDTENKVLVDYIYSLLSDRQKEILQLTYAGYKQQEIGEKLQISQSRISVIKKKTLDKLKYIVKDNDRQMYLQKLRELKED